MQSQDPQDARLHQVRWFGAQVAKSEPVDVFNGIHPGLPMRGAGAHEERFGLLVEDLLTTADGKNPSV